MPQMILMPSKDELPDGPRRKFVAELHEWYRQARRPSLSDLDKTIKADQSKTGTASKETIRRMLKGTTLPRHASTVEAFFEELCKRIGRDPDRTTDPFDGPSARDELLDMWSMAWEAEATPAPAPSPRFDNEPPF